MQGDLFFLSLDRRASRLWPCRTGCSNGRHVDKYRAVSGLSLIEIHRCPVPYFRWQLANRTSCTQAECGPEDRKRLLPLRGLFYLNHPPSTVR